MFFLFADNIPAYLKKNDDSMQTLCYSPPTARAPCLFCNLYTEEKELTKKN